MLTGKSFDNLVCCWYDADDDGDGDGDECVGVITDPCLDLMVDVGGGVVAIRTFPLILPFRLRVVFEFCFDRSSDSDDWIRACG